MMQRLFRGNRLAQEAGRRLLRPRPVTRQRVATYYVKPKQKQGASGQAWLALGGVSTTLVCLGVYVLGKPEDEIAGLSNEPDKYADVNVVKAYILRTRDHFIEFKKSFSEPSREQLLPDMLPPQFQRPYTLVIELSDILFHSEYDQSIGWKYQKRPGVDAFLANLFDHYEIVTFTSENGFSAEPIIRGLDPKQFITYHLYRHDTKYKKGHYIKDLSNINRPLSKVIVVDTDLQSVQYHKENSIIMEKWTGDITDRTLVDLTHLLQAIAANEVDDVRPVLDYYKKQGDKKIVETFKTAQAMLEEREREERERQAQFHSRRSSPGGAISTFSFSKRSQPPSGLETLQQPQVASEPHYNLQDPGSPAEAKSSWTKSISEWIGWK